MSNANATPGGKFSQTFPVFSVVASVAYFLCWGANYAAITYFPALNEWRLGSWTKAVGDSGPPMLWWGWMIYAAAVGAVAAILTLALPKSAVAKLGAYLSWTMWVVPVAMCGAIVYFEILKYHWWS